MSEKRLIITNTLANGIAQFASMISGLILMPWLIRSFGTADYGLYMLAGAVAGYASLMDFGVGSAVVKKVAERAALKDSEGVRQLASTALAFYMLVGLVVAAINVLVAVNTQTIFKVTPADAVLLRNMLLVVAAASLFSWPLSTFGAVLAGYQRYTVTARTSLFASLGTIAVTVAVIVAHQGPFVLILGTSLVGTAAGFINFFVARRHIAAEREVSPLSAERTVFREIVSFSWAIFVIQVCVLVVYQQTDRLLLGIFVGAVAVGLYEAAGKFQGFVQQLAAFSTSAVMPLASNLDSAGRDSALQTLFLRGTKYAIALIAPVVVGLIVLAKPLLLRWLGPQFAAESLAAQVLISHQILTVSTPVGDSVLVGLGKLPKRLPYAVALTVENLVISLLLVKPLGIMGVVIGTTVPFFIDYPFHIHMLLKETDLSYSRFLRDVVAPTYPLLLLTLGASLLFLRTRLMKSIVGIGIAGVACVGIYWLALFFFGLNEVERMEIRHLASSLKSRFAS